MSQPMVTPEIETAAENVMDEPRVFGADKIGWMERFADRMNPILVKEVRQAMKSRVFLITFILLIASCWVMSLVGAISIGSALEYFSYADAFFASYFVPLSIAIGLVIPFLAFHSLQNERVDDTFEMLSITTLNARKIVNGKLSNAMVLSLLCYSAITPFIAFTSLLQGFRLTPVVFAMVLGFLISTALCSIALFASSMARTRVSQGILSLILLVVLGYSTCLCAVVFQPFFWMIPSAWQTWSMLLIFSVGLIFLILLCREIAVARLTFQSDNRTTGVRTVILLIGVTAIGIMFVMWRSYRSVAPAGFIWEVLVPFLFMYFLLLVVVGFFSCTERPEMSRRVRQQVSKWNPVVRIAAIPLLPGCYRGYIYCWLLFFPAIALCCWKMMDPRGSGRLFVEDVLPVVVTIGLYALCYAGIAVFLARYLYSKSAGTTSTFVRSLFLVIIGFMAIAPHLFVVIYEEFNNAHIPYSILMLTCPQSTILEVADNLDLSNYNSLSIVLLTLGFIATALLAINFHGIIRSAFDTVSPLESDLADPVVAATLNSTVEPTVDDKDNGGAVAPQEKT